LGVVSESGSAGQFYERMKRYGDRISLCIVPETPAEEHFREMEEKLDNESFDDVLYVSFVRVTTRPNSGTISGQQQALIRRVRERFPEMTYLLMGSPYALRLLPRFDRCLCTFSPLQVCHEAALDALYGNHRPTGRLPVRVSAEYPFGYAWTP
jgi:hypothetical protein